jgi:hypothetical protein
MPYGIDLKQKNRRLNFGGYALDKIPGAYPSCVAFFSYYSPSVEYMGQCCKVRRLDTGAQKDIGFVNGYIDYIDVINFCTGTTGLVTTIYNSSSAVGKQDAIQLTVGNMPIVYESGAFLHDGFKFNTVDSKRMTIIDYTAIQFIEPQYCIYYNVKPNSTGVDYIFSKNYDTAAVTYAVIWYSTETKILHKIGTDSNNRIVGNSADINHGLFSWESKSTNGLKGIVNGVSMLTTYGSSILNYQYINIGCRSANISNDVSNVFTGNIKTIAIFNNSQYVNYAQLAALI